MLTLLPESQISPAHDAAIRGLLCLCFPNDRVIFARTRAWHGSAPAFSVILEDGRQLIAHVGVHDRTIRAGDSLLRIAGIQNVCVHPDHRGRHLTDQILAAALAHSRTANFDAALLFCVPALEPMYARNGFQLLPPTPITRTHEGHDTVLPPNHSTMCLLLRGAEFPSGPIHLMGDDW